ncbi:hypothetical protein ACFQ0Q_49815 [Streptomyces aureus]
MIDNMDGVGRRGVLAAGLAGVSAALAPAGWASAEPGAGASSEPDGAGRGGRRVLNFNTGWAFWREDVTGAHKPGFDDAQWAAVSLPHTMRLERKTRRCTTPSRGSVGTGGTSTSIRRTRDDG